MVRTGLPIEDNPWNAVSTLMVLLIDCLAAAAMTPNGIDTMVAALSQDNIDERTMYIAHMVAVEISRMTFNMIKEDLPKNIYTIACLKKCSKKLSRVTVNTTFKEICQLTAKNATMVKEADFISPAAYAKSFFLRLHHVALYGTEPNLANNIKEDTETEKEFLSGKNIGDVNVGFTGNLKSTHDNLLQTIAMAFPSVIRETYDTQKECFDLPATLCYDPKNGSPYSEEVYQKEFMKNKPKTIERNGVPVEAALTTVGVIKNNGPLDVGGNALVKGMIPKHLAISALVEDLHSEAPETAFRPQYDYLCRNFTIDECAVASKKRPKSTPPKKETPTMIMRKAAARMTQDIGDILEDITKNKKEDPKKCLDDLFEKLTKVQKVGEESLMVIEKSPAKKRKPKDDNSEANNGDEGMTTPKKKKPKKNDAAGGETESGKPKDTDNEDADKDANKKRSAKK